MTTRNKETIKFMESITDGPLTFGKMLSSLRISDDIAQTELAKKAKVSKGLVCDIEKGRRDASIELAIKLAKIMDYPPETFLSILFEEQLRRAKSKLKVRIEEAA
ncbi:MAG: helix-turn-helix transcriptional regulator [Rhizobacter sp.]|nr:helix-turn-helix transcriptional regulator [Bacteriovorax sp.]